MKKEIVFRKVFPYENIYSHIYYHIFLTIYFEIKVRDQFRHHSLDPGAKNGLWLFTVSMTTRLAYEIIVI